MNPALATLQDLVIAEMLDEIEREDNAPPPEDPSKRVPVAAHRGDATTGTLTESRRERACHEKAGK